MATVVDRHREITYTFFYISLLHFSKRKLFFLLCINSILPFFVNLIGGVWLLPVIPVVNEVDIPRISVKVTTVTLILHRR